FGAWSDGKPRAHDLSVTDPATLTATYVTDAPDSCAAAKTVGSGAWVKERASGGGDTDWFKVTVPARRRLALTLGDLPVDARLQLSSGCSTLLATSDAAGTHFERLTRSLGAGTYRVKVSVPSGASSMTPYVLRVLVVDAHLAIESQAPSRSSGIARIVGD